MSGSSTAGIPGLRGVDHVGISVPDLEEAVRFFCDVLGAEAFYKHGPFRDDETDFNEVSFGVHPRAVVEGIQMLRLHNLNLEVFEWTAPDLNTTMPKISDYGACALALYVDNMDAAIANLRSKGVEVLGKKLDLPGPESGSEATYQYFRTPWGAYMELVSYPHGRAYEKEYHPRRLWSPGTAKVED